MQVSRSFVNHTLLHGSKTWTPYQRRQQNSSHRHCLRRLLGITRRDRITHTALLKRAQLPSVRTLLWQRRRGRMMDESRRTFCMRNCHLATPSYAVGMSPNKTISSSTSALSPGKMQLRAADFSPMKSELPTFHLWNHPGSTPGSKEVKEEAATGHHHIINITRISGQVCLACIGLFQHSRYCNKSACKKSALKSFKATFPTTIGHKCRPQAVTKPSP